MRILALDSAMNGCSVGLYDSETDLKASQSHEMTRGQAEHLMPMVDQILSTNNTSYKDLDMIAVTRGPGAFTGMRIGLATAKSLGLALDIPVIGVDTFKAILQTYVQQEDDIPEGLTLAVLLETKRRDFYIQMFDSKTLEPISSPNVLASHDIVEMISGPTVIVGDACARFKEELVNDNALISYEHIALPSPMAITSLSYKTKDCIGGEGCTPLYIRGPDIGMPKRSVRKIQDAPL